MDKPEALRLADELERDKWHVPAVVMQAAADELRRLHAENEALRNVANRGGHIAVAMSRIDRLEAQRDALLEALKGAAEAFYQYAKEARAAIKAVEEGK